MSELSWFFSIMVFQAYILVLLYVLGLVYKDLEMIKDLVCSSR